MRNSRRRLGFTSSAAPSDVAAGQSMNSGIKSNYDKLGGKGQCGDVNIRELNSAGNSSGPSSVVTDPNTALSGDSRLQRSASFNNDSCGWLPASPLSFNSYNVSGSSVLDGSTAVQQQGASSATSQLMEKDVSNVLGGKAPGVGMRQEDIMQQHVIQHILQRQDQMLPQNYQSLQLQSLSQRHRPPQCRPPLQQPLQQAPVGFQQQPQMRHHLQQQVAQPITPLKRPIDYGLASRRLMQYLYHLRHRPADNSIVYWRKFVIEYFDPQAKERWCFSMYDNIAKRSRGIFPQPQSAADAWQCDLCGSKCGKGFEATFASLPRLFQIKFDHGVDETLFLDMPHESRLHNGLMILEYKKAVQESVFEHLRIVREGVLRIILTPQLKIIRWDFCARKHEEFLPRRVLAPQVNNLLQVAQKYQSAAGSESGSAEVSHQELQASCNMFLAAGRQLSRNLDVQFVNDLGLPKRYVRCLQISEVVSSMKDLIDFSLEHNIGPIESSKNFTKQSMEKFKKQKIQEEQEQMLPCQNLSAAQKTLNNIIGFHPGMSSQLNSGIIASNALNANQLTVARNSYQSLPQSSLTPSQNQNQHLFCQDPSRTLGIIKQGQSLQFQGPASSMMTNSFVNDAPHLYQQQPQFNGGLLQNNIHPSQVNQQMQQHATQYILEGMANKNRGPAQPSSCSSSANDNLAVGDVSISDMPVMMNPGLDGEFDMRSRPACVPINAMGSMAGTNCFNSASSDPNATANSLTSKSDLADNLDLPDFDCIAQELFQNVMFDIDDNCGNNWNV